MADEPQQKSERFNMFISPSELAAIDEWSFQNRIRSKSEAVRRLVQIGLVYDVETRASRDHARKAIQESLAGLNQLSALLRASEGETAYAVHAAMGPLIAGGRALVALFQDMAATDSTANAMESVEEFEQALQDAAEERAKIDAQRTK
ncbi:hypothetical protein NGM99_12695 [Mesorhizobium sp. RP14(2022)]|uniref:CopG family transcriptional regulator n=1 Tax=Mesorhizobium liriopis TaxID=2953882 RepID=A0ABT1C907_9HYPH|nr:hypothetical protein [Mesorhizobium liriopis]MCO6050641.1 hypothetical protein [Mesorhizobium liriopis]